MTRAWVGVVSRSHVRRGVAGGFAQLCHGGRAPLARMRADDWLLYYSPTTEFRGDVALKAFTAVGRVLDDEVLAFDAADGRRIHRRRIAYLPTLREAPVVELALQLEFIRRTPNWGLLARRGHFEVSLADIDVVLTAMGARRMAGNAKAARP